MTVLVFGRGFLGQRLARELPGGVLSPVDITSSREVEAALAEHRPAAVVNAAGKTGRPNVDWCEAHPGETYRANVEGALVVARACAALGVHLLHLGSGCIFYGPSPSPEGWREEDFANPISFYSRTKYAADLVLAPLRGVAVVRLRMPVDGAPGPRNLITKLAGYRRVVDVANSVTVVDDFVAAVAALIERRAEGVFHVTNPGILRHRDLLALYRELVDPAHSPELIDEGELVASGLVKAARSSCILASRRLGELGIAMRPVDVAVRAAMAEYAARVRAGARSGQPT